MPNESFFHRNPKLLGLGRQFGPINFVAFGGILEQSISTHFGTVSNQFALTTYLPVHFTQNPEKNSEFEFDSLRFYY